MPPAEVANAARVRTPAKSGTNGATTSIGLAPHEARPAGQSGIAAAPSGQWPPGQGGMPLASSPAIAIVETGSAIPDPPTEAGPLRSTPATINA